MEPYCGTYHHTHPIHYEISSFWPIFSDFRNRYNKNKEQAFSSGFCKFDILKINVRLRFHLFFLPLVKPRMPSYSMLDIQRYKISGKSAFKNVFLSRNFETLSLIPCQLARSQGLKHIISQIFRLWHRYLFYEAYF